MNNNDQNGTTLTRGIGLFLCLVFLVAFGALSLSADKTTIPEKITLTDYDRTSGPVTFIHRDHGSTGHDKPACVDCHHTTPWDQMPEKCSMCHKMTQEAGTPADIVAFHKLCIGCHVTEIEQGKADLSLSCDFCHKPEK